VSTRPSLARSGLPGRFPVLRCRVIRHSARPAMSPRSSSALQHWKARHALGPMPATKLLFAFLEAALWLSTTIQR
jgi:hypothetical protein